MLIVYCTLFFLLFFIQIKVQEEACGQELYCD